MADLLIQGISMGSINMEKKIDNYEDKCNYLKLDDNYKNQIIFVKSQMKYWLFFCLLFLKCIYVFNIKYNNVFMSVVITIIKR